MKKILLLLSLVFIGNILAQNDSILLMNYYDQNQGAMLKWIPVNSDVFLAGFERGYLLSRAKVIENGGTEKLLPFELLTAEPFHVWPVSKLEKELEKDSSLYVASIFVDGAEELKNMPVPTNEREAIERKQGDGFLHLIGSFSVIADNKVADALGQFFIDKTAELNQKYLYKIEIPGLEQYTSYMLVPNFANQPKEKVLGLNASLAPEVVFLTWYNNGSKNYPYYNIYRSEKLKGKYEKLNELPYVGQQGNAVMNEFSTSIIDSIPEYGKTYYYKVAGVNAFGFEGIASDPVEIKALYLLQNAPKITETEEGVNGEITLNWVFPKDEQKYLTGYNIFRADNGAGPYMRVNPERLSPKTFSFIDDTPKKSSNYYVMSAYGFAGDSTNSLLKAHLLLDSIPPAKPIAIEGKCDTNGILTFKWAANVEADLIGYRLFKTYDLAIEPLRVTSGYTPDTVYTDTLNLKEPFTKIYYRLFALDDHYNPSFPSDWFEIPLPDKNPPTNGSLTEYSVGMQGISLKWQASTAKDLAKMQLLRKSEEDIDYKVLYEIEKEKVASTLSYTDTSTKSFYTYEYALLTIDESGLESPQSNVFAIKQLDKRKVPAVTNLDALVSRENRVVKLEWDFPMNASGFRIYRQRNDGTLSTHKFVDGKVREYYDKEIKPNSEYTYLIVAQLPGGYPSGYSNKVTVKY